MAICDDVVQFARAAESLPPRVLPKYLVAFTDDGPSDTDDNPIMDDDDQFDILTSCEKSPCDVWVCYNIHLSLDLVLWWP